MKGTTNFGRRTDDIHPLVVSQMTQNHPTGCESLAPQLIHVGEQFDGIISSASHEISV